jgi:hypothetical protein
MSAKNEFDRLFSRYRRDAVLLHRPYPPHEGRRTNSWFGGLPALPAHLEWPRAADGTPLHFTAQIDCADVLFPTPLPDRGVLYFFWRDDDDPAWEEFGTDHCRVLYAPDAAPALPRREAPADLPQVGGYFPRSVWPGFAHEGGRGPNLHREWPIHPLPMASWPDAFPEGPDSRLLSFHAHARSLAPSATVWEWWRAQINRMLGSDSDPEESLGEVAAREKRYKEQLHRLRAAAFTGATGERSAHDPNVGLRETRAGGAVFFHAEHGPEAYPQYWITVRHCALALLHRPGVLGADPAMEARLASAGEDWLRRANQAGLDEPVPQEERGDFRAWLTSLRRPNDEAPLAYAGADLVFASTYATVLSWAGDRSRAARVPPSVYEALRFVFNGFSSSGRVYFWQMLGHAESPQDPPPPDEPTVCLLSDPGGFCTYWIEPEDLARRDFSGVVGKAEYD